MMDLAGAPLLGRIVERVKRTTLIDTIVVATTEKPEDDVLAALGRNYGVEVFRGSENDLVDRYYWAGKKYGAELLLRLPADNATPEPREIDRIVESHLNSDAVFSSNLNDHILNNGYPDGIGAEVMDFWAFEEIWRAGSDPHKREHAHLNFYDYGTQVPANPERYPIGTVKCPSEFARPDIVLDVNTLEQYEFIRALYEYLYPRKHDFTILDTINWYDDVYRPAGG
jgi:spore coat polysaccharide biosynthesis protein SpsF